MEMIPFESSDIDSAGFDETSSTLQIKFKRGGVYIYKNVPSSVFQALLVAESKGKFLHTEVKNKAFEYEKIA